MSQRRHTEKLRSRRRTVKRRKESLSSPFMCPSCGNKSFSLLTLIDGATLGKCSGCSLQIRGEFPPKTEIDDYNKLVDVYYAGRTTT